MQGSTRGSSFTSPSTSGRYSKLREENQTGMTMYFVLTAIGRDRVGIVDELAEILERQHCNIEESKMAVLGREFAVILLASGRNDDVESLSVGIQEIRDQLGLHAEIRMTGAPDESASGRPYTIEAVSLDAPGILHSVSAILKESGVNIEEISSDTTSAPWTGAVMFHLQGVIILPPELHVVQLREKLAALEHDRDIDIVLTPVGRTS